MITENNTYTIVAFSSPEYIVDTGVDSVHKDGVIIPKENSSILVNNYANLDIKPLRRCFLDVKMMVNVNWVYPNGPYILLNELVTFTREILLHHMRADSVS